jgi:hypothetical protein
MSRPKLQERPPISCDGRWWAIRNATDSQVLDAGLMCPDELPGPRFMCSIKVGFHYVRRKKDGTLWGSLPCEWVAARDPAFKRFKALLLDEGVQASCLKTDGTGGKHA